jgi:hypothetical protein
MDANQHFTLRAEYANNPHLKAIGGPLVRWTRTETADELRCQFFRAIPTATPEVLEDLRDHLWPVYREEASGHAPYFPLARCSTPLQQCAREYVSKHGLIHNGQPCGWVLAQIEQALAHWLLSPV